MATLDPISDSEVDDASKIADPTSCFDYLKRKEVFLYRMMNDPSHKSMLYFLEVLMNSDSPLTVEQLATRFSNKSFSVEMREACGGGDVESLKQFFLKYPSLFTVKASGVVSAVVIDIPGFDEMSEGSFDIDSVSLNQNENRTSSAISSCKVKGSFREASSINCSSGNKDNRDIKPVGIYKPPILRAEASKVPIRTTSFCEMCSMAAHVSPSAATSFVHCPFAELKCATHHNYHHKHRCSQLLNNSHLATNQCCCLSDNPVTYRQPLTSKRFPCMHMTTFALETEAVRFFRQRLSRRGERWVPIKSLAGHLSQAPLEVRSIVGPQLEFRRFLSKHPYVFEVQGDLVGLKDPFLANNLSSRRPKSFAGSSLCDTCSTSLSVLNLNSTTEEVNDSYLQKSSRPKSLIMLPPAKSTVSQASSNQRLHKVPTVSERFLADRKSETLYTKAHQLNTVSSSALNLSTKTGEDDASSNASKAFCIRMTANEYRAVMFLRKLLVKNGGAPGETGLPYMQIMKILSAKAPETLPEAIGWTKVELEEFVLQHPVFFEVHNCLKNSPMKPKSGITWADAYTNNEHLARVTNRRVLKMINIIITGNKPLGMGTRTLTNSCGRVFHVAKLWGIIDLGKHEHVFFDKSILKYVEDLQKHFKVNETLYFNAILAPKESRAKWRATQVWKECDKDIIERFGIKAFSSQRNLDTSLVNSAASSTAVNNVGVEDVLEPKNATDSDSDYDLKAGEKIFVGELEGSSEIVLSEGLGQSNEIKFLSDDVEEELEKLLGPHSGPKSTNTVKNGVNSLAFNYSSDEDTSITGCIEDLSINYSELGSLSDKERPCVTSAASKETKLTLNLADSSICERSSIAVQTLSTGDIMATQIFHDLN